VASARSEPALTSIYIASCEGLEELGYSVEERPAELEIMQMEDDAPYDGELLDQGMRSFGSLHTTDINHF
jgi:hypothetical protein